MWNQVKRRAMSARQVSESHVIDDSKGLLHRTRRSSFLFFCFLPSSDTWEEMRQGRNIFLPPWNILHCVRETAGCMGGERKRKEKLHKKYWPARWDGKRERSKINKWWEEMAKWSVESEFVWLLVIISSMSKSCLTYKDFFFPPDPRTHQSMRKQWQYQQSKWNKMKREKGSERKRERENWFHGLFHILLVLVSTTTNSPEGLQATGDWFAAAHTQSV